MTFNGRVKNGKQEVYAYAAFDRFLSRMEGQEITIAIVKREDELSGKQRKYYWFIIGIVERVTGNDKDTLHEEFKKMFLGERYTIILGGEEKEGVKMPSITKLSKKRMKWYIEQVIGFCAMELSIAVPSPTEAEASGYDEYYFT